MKRFIWIKNIIGLILGMLLWTALPVWAAAICNANIRATTPTSDFTLDDSNGTATHLKTGLMWMRCALGRSWDSANKTCIGNTFIYTWSAALRAAQGYSFVGYNDWRLPNVNELTTINEDRCDSPSINETVFPGMVINGHWSSSTSASDPTQAFTLGFLISSDSQPTPKSWGFGRVLLVRGGSSFGDYVSGGGGVTETQEHPVYIDPLPPVSLTGYRKYLVLLIHGWNSNPDVWAKSMKTNIVSYLKGKGYIGDGDDACEKPLEKDGVSWQICWYDWKDQAGGLPQNAYVKAETEGKALAKRIASEPRSYDFIHFIAHSAGSRVADTAARELPKRNTSPVIHTTFLDAYDPFGSDSSYGVSTSWAEQYVDIRRVGDYILNNTDITLHLAYNFDITELDPNGNNITGSESHAWPWRWYNQTIVNPDSYYYGFGLSLESGRDQFLSANDFVLERYGEFPGLRRKCVFASLFDTRCSESGPPVEASTVRTVVEDVLDISTGVIIVGTVQFLSDTLKLITSSPAWVSMSIEVMEPIDVLSFDYTYLRQAEGLLSVFFDDQLVFRSDQRVELAGQNHSGNVPIGAITSGTHKLAFRLDAYNNTQSEIDLSRIQLGKMEVNTQVVNLLTVAKAGSGSGTVTSTPTGIDCGATCSASFSSGTSVTLAATPAADSTFVGWSPDSCGSSPFTLTADTTCTATFNLINRPPEANAGPDQTVEYTGPNGTPVTLDGSASSDPDNDPLTFVWTGSFGTASGPNPTVALPLGTHTITLTVDDGHGGTAIDTVVVRVRDTTPPLLKLPADITTEATSASGAAVTYTASAKDLVDGAITPNCTPASGSTFPIGTTTVGCTATDKAENTASGNFKITVVGMTPPPGTSTFSAFSVNPLRINQRLKTFFLLSSFTLGPGSNGIDPTKEPVTLTVAGFTTTIPAGSFRKGSGPFGVYAFAGKIGGVSIEMLITPLGNKRFGFQVAAYGANLIGTKNPVMVEFLIGDDSGTTTVDNAIIR